jgi:hypothetical protein
MLKKDRFKLLLPELAKIKRIVNENESVYWEVYDESGELLAYAFYEVVPDSDLDIPEAEEFDKYELTGIVDLDHKIQAIDICVHPDFEGELWAGPVLEEDFRAQYIALASEEVELSPYGKIDAISECTMSSKLLTETVREKLEAIKLGPS